MLFNNILTSVRCVRSNVFRTQNMMKTKNYGDWVRRRPVAIVNEEIVLDHAEEAKPKPRKYEMENEEFLRPLKPRPGKKYKHANQTPPIKPSDDTYNEDGTPNITRVADNDKFLTTLMMTLRSRRSREINNYIMMEGHRLISDAIEAGVKPEIIIFSRTPDVMKLRLPKKGVKLYKVAYQTIQLWSSLTTSPGIIGIFETPRSFEKETTERTIPLTIVCDNVREPGNLGSIMRAAAGAGCERIILTKGCVDVWEQKVLRSAAGAHFRISISKSFDWDDVKFLISPTAKIFAADNNVTTELKKLSEPLTNANEEETDPTSDDESAPSNSAVLVDENCDETDEKTLENDVNPSNVEDNDEIVVDAKKLASQIPTMPYYEVDYTTNETVMIVGGETEGLSLESLQLLSEKQGFRVNVPLENDVESLNTGMAVGIVAFEIKRQFALKKTKICN